MTVTQVLYALEVARCQNVSRAAERLLLSQSALSQQLRRLEQELGYPIFTRTLHGVQLTPEGERFCEQAAGMARTWKEFQANVQKSALGIRKRLRIGMGSRVYSNDLFQQIAQFFEEHEDLDVAFVTEVGLDFISQLRRGTLDLALDRLPDTNIGVLEKEISICPLIREPQCVLLSPDDPRSQRTSISLYELQGCAITSGLEGSAEESTLLETCRRHGITLNRVYRSDGVETSMNLVRSGRCVALGPASFAAYHQVAAVPLTPWTEVCLCFICRRETLKQPEIAMLQRYLQNVCRERGILAESGK
ncbi:MAG: LysR family transcriptional regulator [Firmicutes bacterium]|nr:LysR family transcriptional regulator [Bacillota bacterium]